NNDLESINITNNTNLRSLLINDNLLTSLDVSSNTVLNLLYCYNNTSLDCIKVNSTQLGAIPSGWQKDADAVYSTNCSL
ncbi:MAG: choice-of-anchor D domain-containing protein, partial [Lutibacter sp.]